ncbi:MAG: domain S-box protein [Flavipsychrobacter sp.]|jgi:PAS domain S-box-containing protein|nr:domain S-box protein [Flavipsychrobacter sp.]
MTTRELQEQLEKERAILKAAKDRIAAQNKELEELRKKVAGNTREDRPDELADANIRFNELINSLNDGVFVVDENRNIVIVNEVFCKLFGIKEKPATLIGTYGPNLLDQTKHLFKDLDQYIANGEKIVKDRKAVLHEEIQLINGQIYSRDFIPIFKDGVFRGHLWRFTDITRQKTIGDTFEAQKKFYEQVLNNIPADIVVVDVEHRFVYVNPTAIVNPETRKWIIGHTNEEYCIHTNKPMLLAENRNRIFNEVKRTKRQQEWEETFQLADGNTRYQLRRMYPVLDEKSEVEMVIGYGVDITERKKIEEKYKGIIENMNLGMIELDKDEHIIYANQRFCTMSGYEIQELMGKTATDLFLRGVSLKRTRDQLSKQRYGIHTNYELAVQTKNGENKWWLTSATPLFNTDETVVGTISIHLDITEQKKMEGQLKEAKQLADRSSKSKDIFLTNMSHEIRTPLNAIMGLGKLLSKSELNAQQKNYLQGIESASTNLLGIVNDLLDFSKIEAGKITLENISFSLETIAEQVVSILTHKAEEKGLLLYQETDKRIAPVLMGDPFRVNQVFMNMVSNAIKFTEKGTVCLKAFLLEEKEDWQKLLVIIEDTGVGIKEEYLNTIFDKFTQEDETVVRKFGGTGLGMSITKQLMELMGGTISVTSKKNVGTTISLTFSFKKGTAKVFEKKRTVKTDTGNISNKKILLVEDNGLNRLLAYTILTDYGAIISEAENGLQAIDMMRKDSYDMVLMDIQMPVMDGIQATKIIRSEINKSIPILALTANAIKGKEHQFIEAGMNDFIFKPYNEMNLVNPIAKWLNKSGEAPAPKFEPARVREDEQAELKNPAQEIPSGPLYDLSKLLVMGRNDENFIKKMLNLFIGETPPAVEKMVEAYKTGDYATVKYYAHRMKPSITNLGINTLRDDIVKIEFMEDPDAEIERLVNKLHKTIALVVEQMTKEYGL